MNCHYEWGNKPLNPGEYVALLAPAYAAIKAACPSMWVISGALTPAGNNGNLAMDDFAYFEAMMQAGGTRFKGTEYVQDFSYDCWVIDQLSEGVVPLFLPDTVDNLAVVGDSFTYVAQQVAAARAQQGVYPVTYPLSGADTLKSRPHWFHQPYDSTGDLDTGLAVQAAGDVATNKDGS